MSKFVMPTRLVLVQWLDAVADDQPWKSWKTTAKQEPALVHSVGYVVREEPEFVTLAASVIVEDGVNGGDVTIPRGMITKIQDLQVKQ